MSGDFTQNRSMSVMAAFQQLRLYNTVGYDVGRLYHFVFLICHFFLSLSLS